MLEIIISCYTTALFSIILFAIMTSKNFRQSCINSAKAFLKKKLFVAAENFQFQYTTLHNSIVCDKKTSNS